ncbi:hypothetical protein F4823DRAFT_562373 [Ustulina deusta]|nr:hypothetical protein F4823DRAFT_562373 [Ustulina deusta]
MMGAICQRAELVLACLGGHDKHKRALVKNLKQNSETFRQTSTYYGVSKPERKSNRSGGIMTRTTDACRHEFTTESDMKATKKGLSRDEVFGNLFVINFADHDATANTCVAVNFF